MAMVIGTDRGWLDVHGYLDAVPERWRLLVGAAANYIDVPVAELEWALRAGRALAEVAFANGKDVDVLKSRVAAGLAPVETSLASTFLNQLVEQLVDLPLADPPADLVG